MKQDWDLLFLTEMFNLKTAKGYEFEITPKEEWPGWPGMVFQATFTLDNGKEYAFRVQRARELGQHTRRMFIMLKGSKNYTQNVTVDKGTFKKVLVTFLRCYEAYKGTSDGKRASSFAIRLQGQLANHNRLFYRAILRAFKQNRRTKLELVGIDEDPKKGKGIEMMTVNPQSSVPYFGGKEYDEVRFTSSEIFMKLKGIKELNNTNDNNNSDSVSNVTSQSASGTQSVNPEPEQSLQNTDVPQVSSSNQSEVETDSSSEESQVEIQHIQSLEDSYSKYLKTDEIAVIVTSGILDTDLIEDFDLVTNGGDVDPISEMLGMEGFIVEPEKYSDKFVFLPNELEDITYTILKPSEYAELKGYNNSSGNSDGLGMEHQELPPGVNVPPSNTEAQTVPVSSYNDLLKDIKPLQINDDIAINFEGVTAYDLIDKIEVIKNSLEGMTPEQVGVITRKVLAHLNIHSHKIANKVAEEIDKVATYKFNDTESRNIKDYTGTLYYNINEVLRGNFRGSETSEMQALGTIKAIDETFKKKSIKFAPDFRIFRGQSITNEQIEDLQSGKYYTLTSYSSCSLDIRIAYDFATIETFLPNIVRDRALGLDLEDSDKIEFSSRQGNKILLDIDRLDRTLALHITGVSSYANEFEILLNRGTVVKKRDNIEVLKVANRYRAENPDEGLWFAKVSCVGDTNELFESVPSFRMFLENVRKYEDTLTNIAITEFFFRDVQFTLEDMKND